MKDSGQGRRRRPHGYVAWRSMVRRCADPKVPQYARYGGVGITICDRWRNSFAAFVEDMGPRPTGLTIDRIDNEKGYEPSNCRWATVAEQNRNKRGVRHITFRDETLTLSEWASRAGLSNHAVLAKRLRNGWPVELALTQGPLPRGMYWSEVTL